MPLSIYNQMRSMNNMVLMGALEFFNTASRVLEKKCFLGQIHNGNLSFLAPTKIRIRDAPFTPVSP